ncbi:MAG: hypothetical protein MI802_00305 [Desulfobacterales bacterium]|nr:hypothetical protein [Desulfobacterales bacterium]
MSKRDKPFEVEKTFGLGVLLKLTKKNVQGVDIATNGSKFTSSLSLDEVNTAVDRIMKTHNIRLKIK